MADYLILATIHVLVGFELYGLGFLGSGGQEEEEAMFIIGFLLYVTSVIMMVLIKAGGLGSNTIALVATIVLIFLAALFILVGVILWGIDSGGNNEYPMTLDCLGMIMAIIGGIFLILVAVGGQGKTSPSN